MDLVADLGTIAGGERLCLYHTGIVCETERKVGVYGGLNGRQKAEKSALLRNAGYAAGMGSTLR